MAVFKDTTITDAGKRLLAQALANRKQITFTKLETSDFDYEENNNIEEVINLNQVKQSINLSGIVQKGTFVTVKGVFTNRGLVNSYEIKTIGCFAKINDENEILYSITRVKTPDTMPAENGINLSTIEIELVTQINNESGAVIKYSPDTLVTKSTLATETNVGVVRYGTTEATALEGAKMAQMMGAEYGGLLQTPGQKEVGKAYYDSVNKQMVSPIENNNLTYYETRKFIPISDLQNAKKLESLFSLPSNKGVRAFQKESTLGNYIDVSNHFSSIDWCLITPWISGDYIKRYIMTYQTHYDGKILYNSTLIDKFKNVTFSYSEKPTNIGDYGSCTFLVSGTLK